MSSDRIDYCDLLADEQMTGSVKHRATLLLRRLVGTNRILAQVTARRLLRRPVVLLPSDAGLTQAGGIDRMV
jgi:hypothetical protein